MTASLVVQAQADVLQWERKHEAARALELAFGPRGVQSLILEAGIERLQAQTNRYLEALSGGELIARFQAYSEYKSTSGRRRAEGDVIETISRQVYAKRKDGQLSVRGIQQLSRGQHRRVELSCALAFAELCREQGHSSNLLVMDEALRFLDSDGRGRLAKLLPWLPQETILVVSHEEASEVLGVASGGVDVCIRNNDCSTVLMQAAGQIWEAIGDDAD
jgi:DNA repair exonuclease SbcCD ATPase subunit